MLNCLCHPFALDADCGSRTEHHPESQGRYVRLQLARHHRCVRLVCTVHSAARDGHRYVATQAKELALVTVR